MTSIWRCFLWIGCAVCTSNFPSGLLRGDARSGLVEHIWTVPRITQNPLCTHVCRGAVVVSAGAHSLCVLGVFFVPCV